MKYNKLINILLVVLMLIIFIGTVSANENVSINQNINKDSNLDISEEITDDTLKAEDIGTFNDLKHLINSSTTGIVELEKDYKYDEDLASVYSRGVVVSDITINGNGHTIDGNNIAKMFRVTGGKVILNNIKFINGYGNNHLPNGGAIHVDAGTLIINNCTFENNTAIGHGGVIGVENINYANSHIEVYNSKFINNTALKDGGAIYSNDVLVVNSLFKQNKVSADLNSHTYDVALGGAIATVKGVVRNSSFIENYEENRGEKQINDGGGAIYAQDVLSVYDSYFENNSAHKGGAIFMYISSPDHSLLVPTRNLTVNNTRFINNDAFNGGAICSNFNITINNTVFDHNRATGYGGGAINTGFRSNGNYILNSNFTANTADNYGGALATSHSHIRNCIFIENGARHGGAIYSLSFDIANSTLKDNYASVGNKIIVIDGYQKDENTYIPEEDILVYDIGDVNDYTHDVLDNAGYDGDMVHSGPLEGYYVFCIEKFLAYPDNTEGLLSRDLSYITNALDQEVVSDYIKIIFYLLDSYPEKYEKYLNKSSLIQNTVHQFTDYDYEYSQDQLTRDVISLYNSGFRINGTTYQLPNGTYMKFDMLVFLTPVDRQNMVLFKSTPFIPEKTPNMTVEKLIQQGVFKKGDSISFTIIVRNTGNCDLTGVYIIDKDYSSGLVYDYFVDNSGKWRYRGNGKWIYDDVLKEAEDAQLTLYFIAVEYGKLYNTVIAGNNLTNETVNSTNSTFIPKNNHTSEKSDNETNKNKTNKNIPKTKIYTDKRATGNPLLVLLLVLITLGIIPENKK